MEKIVILGAGPTGLGAAYRLNEAGHQSWEMYEKNDYIGGLSASFRDDKGFTWDIGGHIIFSTFDRFNRLVKQLLGDKVLAYRRESWIWLMDHFVRYPFQNNFHMHPNKEIVLECASGLLNHGRERNGYKNFEEWIYHYFGDGIARRFMIPYNRKVWACPLNEMDYNWIADRVSVINPDDVLRNLIYERDDGDWGPNHMFQYPLHGGTGGLFDQFLPYVEERLFLNRKVEKISLDRKEVVFQDGKRVPYDRIISSIPLNELINKLDDKPNTIAESSRKLRWSGGYIVGIGVQKPCPSKKNWIYFPEDNSPFYRVTYLSNYSPHLTPKGDYFSFLAETSHSESKRIAREKIVDETIQGLINSRLLQEKERSLIVSTCLMDVPHSMPIPILERDKALKEIQSFLSSHQIYSRGRFGGWKYEIGNMDHSVLQGIEVVERILYNQTEKIYTL
jgi:protoporphyrinogen oxidase